MLRGDKGGETVDEKGTLLSLSCPIPKRFTTAPLHEILTFLRPRTETFVHMGGRDENRGSETRPKTEDKVKRLV